MIKFPLQILGITLSYIFFGLIITSHDIISVSNVIYAVLSVAGIRLYAFGIYNDININYYKPK